MSSYTHMIESGKAMAADRENYRPEAWDAVDLVRDLTSALEVVLSQRNAMTQVLNGEVLANQETRSRLMDKLNVMRQAPSLKAIADELIATIREEQ